MFFFVPPSLFFIYAASLFFVFFYWQTSVFTGSTVSFHHLSVRKLFFFFPFATEMEELWVF